MLFVLGAEAVGEVIVTAVVFESVVTNTVYYGIALLFGIGNAFDSIVSLIAYGFLLKKEKINVLRVE